MSDTGAAHKLLVPCQSAFSSQARRVTVDPPTHTHTQTHTHTHTTPNERRGQQRSEFADRRVKVARCGAVWCGKGKAGHGLFSRALKRGARLPGARQALTGGPLQN